ncbi:hypothetical protein BV25DRAFT_1456380 [Artomyces pyxidatus]|uniref:Uncharacterized protein n=1 Tax=Artomyces pyxidatus TaxID=48021 RepID=A0ACB8SN00_9AGAM|nr:hypothetical protein BV25DRAFT_1456380 [Artomyces pyxidatus]
MSENGLLKKWLPVAIFPALSASAYYFLVGHLVKSGAGEMISGQCPPHSGPYSFQYTGFASVDTLLCILVVFFHSSFGPKDLPFIADFAASWAAVVAFPLVEAAREGRPRVLAFPALVGLLYQTQGAGIVLPLYWVAVILSGQASVRLPRARAKITQAYAEATLFAFFIGFVVLSALMLTLADPAVTALWQPFPLWMWLAQRAHLLVRRPAAHTQSGYATVQALYAFTFLLSAISHFAAVWPALGDYDTLKYYYVPTVAVPAPSVTTLASAAHVFLLWDGLFAFGSGLLLTLWFAENFTQLLTIVAWIAVSTPVVGSGAAMSGILMWRERRLNGDEDEGTSDGKSNQ